jgi:hypothetical protein
MLNSIIGKLLLTILGTMCFSEIALLPVIAYGYHSPLLLKIVSVITTGLISGLLTRHILKKHTGLLRLMTSFTGFIATLSLIHYATFGFLGINIFTGVNITPDWDSLIQVVSGVFVAWLGLHAFKKKPQRIGSQRAALKSVKKVKQRPQALVAAEKFSANTANQTRSFFKRIGLFNGNPKQIEHKISMPQNGNRTPTLSIPRRSSQAKVAGRIKPRRRQNTLRWKKKKVDQQVNLVGAEDHQCPFCLEPVIFDDPRGVEICPICKTHHHADCWEVTGVCQVPHYQE